MGLQGTWSRRPTTQYVGLTDRTGATSTWTNWSMQETTTSPPRHNANSHLEPLIGVTEGLSGLYSEGSSASSLLCDVESTTDHMRRLRLLQAFVLVAVLAAGIWQFFPHSPSRVDLDFLGESLGHAESRLPQVVGPSVVEDLGETDSPSASILPLAVPLPVDEVAASNSRI